MARVTRKERALRNKAPTLPPTWSTRALRQCLKAKAAEAVLPRDRAKVTTARHHRLLRPPHRRPNPRRTERSPRSTMSGTDPPRTARTRPRWTSTIASLRIATVGSEPRTMTAMTRLTRASGAVEVVWTKTLERSRSSFECEYLDDARQSDHLYRRHYGQHIGSHGIPNFESNVKPLIFSLWTRTHRWDI